jgi:hypothetical protein
MGDINELYIQKALDGIIGKASSITQVKNGMLLVQTFTEKQAEVMPKAKLLTSHLVHVPQFILGSYNK